MMTGFIHALIDLPLIASVLLKITVVLGLGWIAHFSLAHVNPRWRVLLWRCIVVGVCLVPALVPLQKLQISVVPSPDPPAASRDYAVPEHSVPAIASAPRVEPSVLQELTVRNSSHNPQPPFSFLAWLGENIWMMVFTLWGVVAAILTSRLWVGLVRMKRSINNSFPAPGHLQRMMIRVAGDLNCRREVSLRISPNLFTPFLAGLRRPVIVLPERMISDDYADESPAILAHEVAHLCSGDLFWMLVTKWISALLWFHPLIWKLQDVHNSACEEVCDAVAADYVGNAESYSSALARVALEILGRTTAIGVIPMARSSDVLNRLRMLKRNLCSRPLAGRWVALSVLVGLAVFVCLGSTKLVYAAEDADIRTGGFELDQLDEKLLDLRSGGPSEEQESERSTSIILRLVDSDGVPVSGAKVGDHVKTVDIPWLNSNLRWSLRSEDKDRSNRLGEITLTRDKLFPPSWSADRKMGLYILHEERRIGAICELSKDDKRQVIELKLEPVCRVHGRLDSEGLKKVGRPLTWTNVYMSRRGDNSRILSHLSEEQRFEFSVPPGEYELDVYGSVDGASTKYELKASGSVDGTSTKIVQPKVNIKAGQSELDMGVIDLPPTKLSTLLGQAAPELGPIKAWKNGSSVKLADLRGKPVILHFGGDYPSTHRDLPILVDLHEDLERQGLVIISLYNCESMEQLEQRFTENSEKHGGEPEVPFRVAVDGGDGRLIEGTDRTIPGDTYAKYGISAYPTTVLIDQKGRIVEQLNLYQAKKKLETMLGFPIESELATWRQRFNKTYFLEDGLALKRIGPPFIPERQDYHEQDERIPAIEGPFEHSLAFHWDGQLRIRNVSSYLRKMPLKRVLAHSLELNRIKYEGPEELLEIDVFGDWIIRKDASEGQILKALEGILAKEIGRKIRFVKRTVNRKAIVATGSFKYHRLPAVQSDRGEIHMFCGEFNMGDASGGGIAASVHEFLEKILKKIGGHVNMSVIDQSGPPGKKRIISYSYHRSADLTRIEDPAEKEEKVLQLLDNISRQTNLQFRLAQHPVEKWFVIEDNQD